MTVSPILYDLLLTLMQIPSLYRNPAAIDFELASIADLILDPTLKAAVEAEIETRIQTSQVTNSASALVMWESLGNLRTDEGSGASAGAYSSWVHAYLLSTDTFQIWERRPRTRSKAGSHSVNTAFQITPGTPAVPRVSLFATSQVPHGS